MGKACKAPAGESGFCYFHDPEKREERRQSQAKGGKTGKRKTLPAGDPGFNLVTIFGVSEMLGVVIKKVLAGEVDYRIANSVSVLSGNLLRALESGALEQRIEILEQQLEEKHGRSETMEESRNVGTTNRRNPPRVSGPDRIVSGNAGAAQEGVEAAASAHSKRDDPAGKARKGPG